MNHAKQARTILALLKEHAPTDRDRQLLDDVFQEAAAELPAREVLTFFTGVLHDGLAFGNWLWVARGEA